MPKTPVLYRSLSVIVCLVSLVLSGCSGNYLGILGAGTGVGSTPVSSGGAGDSSDSDSNGGNDDAANSPIDIPVTIAKLINPISPHSVMVVAAGANLTYSAAAEANAVIDVYDRNQNLVAQTQADGSGNFSIDIPLASVPYEDPVAFVVRDGEDLSPAVTVRAYSDDTYTVGVSRQEFQDAETNDYSIVSGYDLAYADVCEGILYNARHTDLHYALLCTNLDDTETVIVKNNLTGPLHQMQVSPDGSFLVGLNSANEIVHLDFESGVETVISDAPVESSHPVIRLSPNGQYVVTTTDPGSLPHLATFEPTTFTAGTKDSDSTVLNEGVIFYNIVECDWIGNSKVQCIVQNPGVAANVQYNMYRFDLAAAFAAEDTRPVITGAPHGDFANNSGPSPATRNLRVNPNFEVVGGWTGAHFIYESEDEALTMNNLMYNLDLFGVGIYPYNSTTSVTDGRWEDDGFSMNFAIRFSDSIHPSVSKIFRYTPGDELVTGDPTQDGGPIQHAGFGTKPLPVGDGITAYLCQDIDGNEQICVLNWDNIPVF